MYIEDWGISSQEKSSEASSATRIGDRANATIGPQRFQGEVICSLSQGAHGSWNSPWEVIRFQRYIREF